MNLLIPRGRGLLVYTEATGLITSLDYTPYVQKKTYQSSAFNNIEPVGRQSDPNKPNTIFKLCCVVTRERTCLPESIKNLLSDKAIASANCLILDDELSAVAAELGGPKKLSGF